MRVTAVGAGWALGGAGAQPPTIVGDDLKHPQMQRLEHGLVFAAKQDRVSTGAGRAELQVWGELTADPHRQPTI
jgi:hypothetical protein